MTSALPARVIRRLSKAVTSLIFLDQWAVLVADAGGYESLEWSAFRPLIPPADRYWADPFILSREQQHCVFIEEKMYATGLGRIACLILDASGQLLSRQVVLERPYHLSYPFVFEAQGEQPS